MAFQFSGLLQDTPVADMVRLLQSTRRTGCLVLNPEGVRGAVYFERGEIVDAQANQLSGLDAIRHLAHFNRGTFEFMDGASSPNRTLVDHPTTSLIEVIEARMMEAMQIQELRPTPGEIPHYLGGSLPADFEVNASELAVAMKATSGNLSVARLSEELGLDQTMVGYTVARFRAAGLMEILASDSVTEQDATAAIQPVPERPKTTPLSGSPTPTPGATPTSTGSLPRYWRGRRIDQ